MAQRVRSGCSAATRVAVCRLVAVCALAGVALLAPAARALGPDDVAGTLDGEAVTLREVDAVTEGGLSRSWREIDAIVRTSARAICSERLLARDRGRRGDLDEAAWRAGLWNASVPAAADVAAALESAGRAPVTAPLTAQLRHALHVDAYHRAVAEEVDPLLAEAYVPADLERERAAAPAVVAQCAGVPVTRAEVEAFAAFPLFRRRAAIVSSACRQLVPDYSMPLVLARLAKKSGRSAEDLLKSAEGAAREPDEEEIEAVARERYGRVGAEERAKVRLALTAVQRSEARLRWQEELRANTRVECALEPPPAPRVVLRERAPAREPVSGSGRIQVVLFGAFRCRQCPATWDVLERLRVPGSGKLAFELRHYFPDKSLGAFEDAVAAECSAAQGRLFDYVAGYRAEDGASTVRSPETLADRAEGPDRAAAAACVADPRTAVRVLADVEEGRRLGFGEVIPAWVVDGRPRRGFQGEAVLRDMIEAAQGASSRPRSRNP